VPERPNEVDLTGWLIPGEPVRWQMRVVRTVPWPRLILVDAAQIALVSLAATTLFPRGTTHATELGIGILVVFGLSIVGNTIVRVLRHRRPRWYVVTDRRAAVFEAPNRLISQTRLQTSQFFARRGRDGRSGTVDWGPSDPIAVQLRRSTGIRPSSFRVGARQGQSLLGLGDDTHVEFRDVADLDVVLAVARETRAAWGVTTPQAESGRSRRSSTLPLGFCDSETEGTLNGIVLAVGSAVLSTAGALLIVTLAPGTAAFSFAPVAVLFALIFPLHFWTVLVLIGRRQAPGEPLFGRRRTSSRGGPAPMEFPFQNLPVTAICLVAAVFLAAGVSAAHVFTSDELFGQPAYNAVTHVYTENDHGNVVRVTKATYDRAVTAQNRVFLSGVVAFSALSVGVTSDELIRRRRSPHAKRRRRRPTTA
jgi:hypothetical protein